MATELTEQDRRNQASWTTTAARDELDGNELYTDPGEGAAIELVRDRVRNTPILDLGVGLGRTIPILKPIASEYLAIDYMPLMVKTCHERFPDARVIEGDARELAGCPSNHFGLVQFSYNGIDAVTAADRKKVFRAVRRVLAPGGIFLFSALNMEGPGYREKPWHIPRPETNNPLRYALSIARTLRWMPRHVKNWMELQKFNERGPGYAVSTLSAHHFTIVAHYTTLERQLDELAREGFSRDAPVFENRTGGRVHVGDDTSRCDWFHFVAEKV